MHAWFMPSPDTDAPLLVLLPMMGHTHESFDPLIEVLYSMPEQEGRAGIPVPNILSVDLRGHGASVVMGSDSLSYRTMSPEEFRKYPDDVKTVVERLLADKSLRINRKNITILGASIGANTAIMAANLLSGVVRVAMLSPGLDYRSLEPADAMKAFGGDVYISASDDDEYSANSSRSLAALAPERTVLHIYEGAAHGTNIIDGNQGAMNQLVEWLVR